MNLRKFMTALYDNKEENDHILVWVPTKRGGKSTWFKNIQQATKFIAKRKKQNVYFQVGMAGRPHGASYRCSTIEAKHRPVISMPALFCDIDIKDKVHKHENLPETIEQALTIIEGFGFDPSVTVHSGHGLQAYWIFKEPWELRTPELRLACMRLLAHLKATLKANAEKAGEKAGIKGGWHIDSVQDMARILRPPGSRNVKNPLDIKKVYVMKETSYRYNPEDFEDFLIDMTFDEIENYMPQQPQTESKAKVIVKEPPKDKDGNLLPPKDLKNFTTKEIENQPPIMPQEDGSIILDLESQPPLRKLIALVRIDPVFAQTWHGRNSLLKDQSQSGYDMSLCHQVVKLGWNDQEIANMVIANRRLHERDPHKGLRKDYMLNTLIKARKEKEKKSADQTSSVGGETLGTQYENIYTEEELKESLKVLLGLNIIKIEKYLADSPTYAIFSTKGKITLRNTDELTSPSRLKNRVFECTKQVIKFDRKKWDDILWLISQICKDTPLDADELILHRIKHCIVDYLDTVGSSNSRKEDALIDKRPFIEYNHWHINFDNFYQWLRNLKGEEERSHEVKKTLRDLKCTKTRMNVERIKGDPKSRTTLRVWRVPNAIMTDALAAQGYVETPENFEDSELLESVTVH